MSCQLSSSARKEDSISAGTRKLIVVFVLTSSSGSQITSHAKPLLAVTKVITDRAVAELEFFPNLFLASTIVTEISALHVELSLTMGIGSVEAGA